MKTLLTEIQQKRILKYVNNKYWSVVKLTPINAHYSLSTLFLRFKFSLQVEIIKNQTLSGGVR